jgi:hypothetical protein
MNNRLSKYLFLFLILVDFSVKAQVDDFLFSPEGIAEVHITLADGKQISDIKNEKAQTDYAGKVKATMTIVNSALSTYKDIEFYSGKILIDGRGNTSWHHDKRPYNIDLVGEDWETGVYGSLLGMPSGDEWCLLAFWEDRSLMRFQIASYMGQFLTGMSWVPRNRYVEVWINNDYRGLYALSEKVQRDDNRVDIKKLTESSTDISGGYLLEASTPDKLKPIDQAVQFRTTYYDINFTFKYPKPQNVTTDQQLWIKKYLDEFETVLQRSTFSDPVTGYPSYINDSSFIDWLILYELSKGCDNLFHASVFVYKDRNGKLNMSSPWDFDLSYGNSGIYTIEGSWVRTHRWFAKLYKDPVFAQKFNNRFIELLPLFNSIPKVISANYEQLENSGVLDREYNKFPAIINDFVNKDGNKKTPSSYKGHDRYLSEWFMARKDWVFIDLGLSDNEKGSRMRITKPVIRVLQPENVETGESIEVKVMRSQDNLNNYKYSWNDASFGYEWYRALSQKGKYWVKIKDQWGNISLASDTLYFGIETPTYTDYKNEDENLFTFSNPAHDLIRINYPNASIDSRIYISLWNMQGVKSFEADFNITSGNNILEVPVSEMQRGFYILRLITRNKTITQRIILN